MSDGGLLLLHGAGQRYGPVPVSGVMNLDRTAQSESGPGSMAVMDAGSACGRGRCGGRVGPKEVVDLYYQGWINKNGDLSEVPIAPNFRFRGPVASFDSAEGYRAMAREAGKKVTKFTIRHQFAEGNRICSIIDWEMALRVAPMTSAELLEVENGCLVRGELIYDAQELRAAMAAAR